MIEAKSQLFPQRPPQLVKAVKLGFASLPPCSWDCHDLREDEESKGRFLWQDWMLFCVDPVCRIPIQIDYAERYPAAGGAPSPSFARDAAAFFDSIEFRPRLNDQDLFEYSQLLVPVRLRRRDMKKSYGKLVRWPVICLAGLGLTVALVSAQPSLKLKDRSCSMAAAWAGDADPPEIPAEFFSNPHREGGVGYFGFDVPHFGFGFPPESFPSLI